LVKLIGHGLYVKKYTTMKVHYKQMTI